MYVKGYIPVLSVPRYPVAYSSRGSYTAFSFAFVPTGDAELMYHSSYMRIFYVFFYINILHINDDCTAKKRK